MKLKIVVVVLLIVALLVGYYVYQKRLELVQMDVSSLIQKDYIQMHEILKERIQVLGSKQAYQLTLDQVKDRNLGTQRLVMVVYGEVLFELEGEKSLQMCGKEAKYGCFHGVFYKMAEKNGGSFTKQAEEICLKYSEKPDYSLTCQHGIGRAIAHYFGPEYIDQALDACSTLSWPGSLFGCQDGVFVEYHFPRSNEAKNELIHTISFKDKSAYEPCSSVEKRYQKDCYYVLPLWWLTTHSNDYAKAGELCEGIENGSYRKACYVSIGRLAATPNEPMTEEAKDRLIDNSEAVCSMINGDYGKLWCFAASYWTTSLLTDRSYVLCDRFQAESRRQCLDTKSLASEMLGEYGQLDMSL